jgi:alpha-beta hydrolase superfamily lysophospholipase
MSLFKYSFLIILLSLTSCGVFIKQPRYNRTDVPKEISDGTDFHYSDGSRYFVNQRICDSSKVIVICVPGLGGNAGNYTFLQDDFANRRISTVSIDLRGFGHWTGRKGDMKNIGLHINDIDQIVDHYRKRYPGKKILLLGESLGTSLCIWYSSIYPEKTDGLILTSLVTKKGMEEVRFKTVLNLMLGYTFSPGRPVLLDFDPSVYTDDTDLKDWLRHSDTLGSRKISAKYLLQSNRVIKYSYKFICTFDSPVEILQGGKDFLSDQNDIRALLKTCIKEKIQYEYFPAGCHSLVNSLNRKDVFNSIAEWIRKYYKY